MRNKRFRIPAIVAAAMERLQNRMARIFLSKGENDRRAVRRAIGIEQKVTEAERLDRLRNPSRYQGR
jgi:hypothetical protein